MKSGTRKPWQNLKRSLSPTVKQLRNSVDQYVAEYQTALSRSSRESKDHGTAIKQVPHYRQAQQLIQLVAAEAQQRVHSKIALIVSRCLSSLFGKKAYKFEIRFDKKRGKTEAVLFFRRGKLEVDPMEASGGGVIDIASFALRVACILSAVPRLRKLIVLDEPYRHLALDLRPLAMTLMQELAGELDIQFIIVSHFDPKDIQCGKVCEI